MKSLQRSTVHVLGMICTLSILLSACTEPERVELDTSGLDLNPTQAELEAIFGIDTDPVPTVPESEPDETSTPVTYSAGPQSITQTMNSLTEERVFDADVEFRSSTSSIRFMLDLKG